MQPSAAQAAGGCVTGCRRSWSKWSRAQQVTFASAVGALVLVGLAAIAAARLRQGHGQSRNGWAVYLDVLLALILESLILTAFLYYDQRVLVPLTYVPPPLAKAAGTGASAWTTMADTEPSPVLGWNGFWLGLPALSRTKTDKSFAPGSGLTPPVRGNTVAVAPAQWPWQRWRWAPLAAARACVAVIVIPFLAAIFVGTARAVATMSGPSREPPFFLTVGFACFGM
jgi:hypothetical protein